MGEIYETVNTAIALHRTIIEPSSELVDLSPELHSGNKLATLAADILLASASLSLASFRKPKVVEIMSAAISDAVRAEFSDFLASAEVERAAQSFSSSTIKSGGILSLWLSHIKLRHGAMLGTSCEAVVLLSYPSLSDIDAHILTSAHRFGTSWACLCRLLDEYEFVNTKLASCEELTPTTILPLTFPCLGFHQAGVPEPILADFAQSMDWNTMFGLYSKAVTHLSQDLETSLGDLLKTSLSGRANEEKQLLVHSVELLLKDCGSVAHR